jgi:hypothetical protein
MMSIYRTSIWILILFLVACEQGVKPTPRKYRYLSMVSPREYAADSSTLLGLVDKMLKLNLRPFTPASYYTSETRIWVDSVLYGPDKRRLVVLVIDRVPNSHKSTLDYNGYFLFCDRATVSSPIRVYEYSDFILGNYDTYSEIKEALWVLCFKRLATSRSPAYNMDDVRFWNSNKFNRVLNGSPFMQFQ